MKEREMATASHGYKFIRVEIDCGEATIRYQITEPGAPEGSQGFDDPEEDREDWSEDDYRSMAAALLCYDGPEEDIEVIYR